MLRKATTPAFCLALLLGASPQDLPGILQKADTLLEEAKKGYDEGRARSALDALVEAGFKLEEARIKYLVLQEIGPADMQKTAGERLRSVQQLTKLINDGRVALSKSRAPEPATLPDPVPPGAPPPPAGATPPPLPAPVRPEADAVARMPVPDATAQKEADRLLRDLHKDAFSKKTPAEQKVLARFLLDLAPKMAGDAPGLHAVYRAAMEAGAAGCDVPTLLFAIDELARLFDLDAQSLKITSLTAAAKNARSPQEFTALTEALLQLSADSVAVDLYEIAEKAAAAAALHGKRAGNQRLAQRSQARVRDVAEARSKFQSLKGNLETLAKTPDHPGANLEMGQFLCFVKGEWDLGVRFLAKGADATLKAVAEKEMALPTKAADLAALGDLWVEISDKEKSPLRKAQMLAHARTFYEAALPLSVGLIRAKIEKVLAERSESGPSVKGPVDLLTLIDPAQDGIAGTWKKDRQFLVGSDGARARLQIPFIPPDEYDLTIVAERVMGDSTVAFGLTRGTSQWAVLYDTWPPEHKGGLEMLDGKPAWENSSTIRGRLVPFGKMQTFEFKVRKAGVTTLINGKSVITWQGDFSRLSPSTTFPVADGRALFLGFTAGEMRYSKLVLMPVTGQGRLLR